MPSHVTLVPITAAHRDLMDRLWQLYRHDLSEFRDTLPDPSGLFTVSGLRELFDGSGHVGYLAMHGDRPVGFVVVGRRQGRPLLMSEFFVVRAVRRAGVGREAALAVLRQQPGEWEIPFQEENPAAARFWRGIATEVAGDRWVEDRRPVPGKPHLPHDVWITLTV